MRILELMIGLVWPVKDQPSRQYSKDEVGARGLDEFFSIHERVGWLPSSNWVGAIVLLDNILSGAGLTLSGRGRGTCAV